MPFDLSDPSNWIEVKPNDFRVYTIINMKMGATEVRFDYRYFLERNPELRDSVELRVKIRNHVVGEVTSLWGGSSPIVPNIPRNIAQLKDPMNWDDVTHVLERPETPENISASIEVFKKENGLWYMSFALGINGGKLASQREAVQLLLSTPAHLDRN